MPGPWEKYAAQQGPWTKYAHDGAAAPTVEAAPTAPTLGERALQAGENFLSGVGGGAIGLMNTGSEWAQKHLPAFLTNSDFGFGKPVDEEKFREQYVAPHGTAQKAGNAAEKVSEFFIPGAAEDAFVEAAPKAAAPFARVGTSALSSGVINKAQGGSFGTGAALGAGGEVLGAAGKKAAPRLVEWAQGIHPTPGARTGKAILDETRSIFPAGVRRSAQGVLDRLNPEMEGLVDRASVRPATPIRGFLPPPAQEIPLGEFEPDVKGELIPAARFPQENVGESRVIRNKKGQILPKAARKVEFPESKPPARISPIRSAEGRFISSDGMTPEGPGERPLLPIGRDPNNGRMLSRTPTRSAFMASGTHEAADLPRSGPGVWMRTPEVPSELPHIPAFEPNPTVSLGPARKVAHANTEKAFGRNEPKMYKGAKRLEKIVNEDLEGNSLPEFVTPRKALELRRGVDTALPPGSFHPESTNVFKGYRTPLRDALNESIGEVVPGYRPLAKRISALIPATETPAKGFGHLWGPGAGAIFGGYYGARAGARNNGGLTGALEGGLLGAGEGATAGSILPAALNLNARIAASRAFPMVFAGTASQATRKKGNR